MSDAPLNDWLPMENADFRNWGPWIFHGMAKKRPSHVRVNFGRDSDGDVVVYLTENGSGWGRNHSPTWEDITWYRLQTRHPYYITARATPTLSAAMELPEVRARIEAAYLAGFNSSGEGWNGEYPFHDNNQDPTQDKHWAACRDAALAPFTTVKETL